MNNKIYELKNTIFKAEREIIALYSEEWEKLYKNRCDADYIEFEEFVDNLAFWNDRDKNGECRNNDIFKRECKIDIEEAC